MCFAEGGIYVFAIFNPLTLQETGQLLAASVAEGGFGCDRAINLDGGTSTQVYVDVAGKKGMIGTPRPVQNFVGFFVR